MGEEPNIQAGSIRGVYLVDDDDDVRIALQALLEASSFHVIAFESAEEFLERADLNSDRCLVLDVRLGGLSGIGLQRQLSKLGCNLPIIFISGHGNIPMAVRAVKSGATEFLTKPLRPRELVRAVDKALDEFELRKDTEQAAINAARLFKTLTPREKDVMALVVAGQANKQVAITLGISEPTVKAHRGQIMRKMNASNLPQLVRLAIDLPITL